MFMRAFFAEISHLLLLEIRLMRVHQNTPFVGHKNRNKELKVLKELCRAERNSVSLSLCLTPFTLEKVGAQ